MKDLIVQLWENFNNENFNAVAYENFKLRNFIAVAKGKI